MGKELRDLQYSPAPSCRATAPATTDFNGIQPETHADPLQKIIFQDKDNCEIATALNAKGLVFTAASDLYSKNKTT